MTVRRLLNNIFNVFTFLTLFSSDEHLLPSIPKSIILPITNEITYLFMVNKVHYRI